MPGLGPNQQKILLLLLAGVVLGMNASPRGVRKIVRATVKDWKNINRQSLERSFKSLEKQKYLVFKKRGTVFFSTLTAKGRKQAFFSELQQMKIAVPKVWDGWWRVVLFDIPEDHRKIRNYLRTHLKRMNFFELQKSVFVYAYDCEKEMQRMSNYFGNGQYIRFIQAKRIDNEDVIKKYFRIC